MGLLLITDIWEESLPEQNQKIAFDAYALATSSLSSSDDTGMKIVYHTWYIAACAALSALVALFEIFRFRNRLTQLKLGFLNVLLMMVVLGSSVYFIFEGEALSANKMQGDFEVGIYLPGLALIMNLLANRFIRRDEQLVRSVDRLR